MLSFATEFPISNARTSADFLESVRSWILGSPHTKLTSALLDNLPSDDEFSVEEQGERLESLRIVSGSVESSAIRYTKRDTSLEWVTTVSFSRQQTDSWIGIRTTCESRHPSAHLPPAKKPVLVRTILNSLGAGYDGPLLVQAQPHLLADADIDIAARLITGAAAYRLPVVYVSANFLAAPIVDVNALAKALAGMAHVVVEPNRPFSVRLKDEVQSQNVYGGTCGIYWPDGGGRRSFFLGQDFISGQDIEIAIIVEITDALANRRPLARCTWSSVQDLASKRSYQVLRDAGSTNLDDYSKEFDKELKTKNEELADAEREISRLQAEIRKYEAKVAVNSGITLHSGTEQDLYENEVRSILRDALEGAPERLTVDSRRRHVLESICHANPVIDAGKARREQLKEILRGYTSMDSKIKKSLNELGFEVSEEGKHFKLTFQSDDRYTFTLPKSGSDYRGGLNAASDISRLLF